MRCFKAVWRLCAKLSLRQLNREFLKVDRYCLTHILAEFIPSLRFREDGRPERTSTIAAFLRVANLEDYLHANSIAGADRKAVKLIHARR